MRVVAVGVEAVRRRLGDVRLVRRHRVLVDGDRVGEPADAEVDVRRHVDHVAGGRHQRRQPVGERLGPLRRGRGLHRVDVEMDGVGVAGVRGQRLLQRRHQVGLSRLRRPPVLLPVVPGREVHQRVAVEGEDVRIAREAPGNLGHGLGIGGIERRPVGGGIGRVAPGERLDQRSLAFNRRSAQRHGPLDPRHRRRDRFAVHGRVDVGPKGVGLAPETERAAWVDALRRPKGA